MLQKEQVDNLLKSDYYKTTELLPDGTTVMVFHARRNGGVFIVYVDGFDVNYEKSYHISYELLIAINRHPWDFFSPDPKPESCPFRKHELCTPRRK